jgi:hypothetical protein
MNLEPALNAMVSEFDDKTKSKSPSSTQLPEILEQIYQKGETCGISRLNTNGRNTHFNLSEGLPIFQSLLKRIKNLRKCKPEYVNLYLNNLVDQTRDYFIYRLADACVLQFNYDQEHWKLVNMISHIKAVNIIKSIITNDKTKEYVTWFNIKSKPYPKVNIITLAIPVKQEACEAVNRDYRQWRKTCLQVLSLSKFAKENTFSDTTNYDLWTLIEQLFSWNGSITVSDQTLTRHSMPHIITKSLVSQNILLKSMFVKIIHKPPCISINPIEIYSAQQLMSSQTPRCLNVKVSPLGGTLTPSEHGWEVTGNRRSNSVHNNFNFYSLAPEDYPLSSAQSYNIINLLNQLDIYTSDSCTIEVFINKDELVKSISESIWPREFNSTLFNLDIIKMIDLTIVKYSSVIIDPIIISLSEIHCSFTCNNLTPDPKGKRRMN